MPPRWVTAAETLPARCEVDGVMAPVDRSATARPINFRVWLPAVWNGRAVQQGGGGMNGSIPDLSGARYTIGGQTPAALGFVTYGSDSGHQTAAGAGRGRAGGVDATGRGERCSRSGSRCACGGRPRCGTEPRRSGVGPE